MLQAAKGPDQHGATGERTEPRSARSIGSPTFLALRVISTRTIQTRLLVRDGHTAVLGGLTDTQRELTRSGIPVLSSIPILGGLFGKQISRTVETELFVFLTPRLIRSDSDLDDAAAQSGDKTQPLLRGLKERPRAPLPADSTPPPRLSDRPIPARS